MVEWWSEGEKESQGKKGKNNGITYLSIDEHGSESFLVARAFNTSNKIDFFIKKKS